MQVDYVLIVAQRLQEGKRWQREISGMWQVEGRLVGAFLLKTAFPGAHQLLITPFCWSVRQFSSPPLPLLTVQ